MKSFILFIIVILILGWLAQNFTDFKAFDYAKDYWKKIDWQKIKGFKIPGLSGPAPTYPPADKQLNVFIREAGFVPNANAIQKGAKVIWYNEDNKPHTVTGENWGSAELMPGQSFSKVFEISGNYQYHCSLYLSMKGEIIVQ